MQQQLQLEINSNDFKEVDIDDVDLSIIKERNADVVELCDEIYDLKGVYEDFAVFLELQGEDINYLEKSFSEIELNTGEGVKHLEQAEVEHKKTTNLLVKGVLVSGGILGGGIIACLIPHLLIPGIIISALGGSGLTFCLVQKFKKD